MNLIALQRQQQETMRVSKMMQCEEANAHLSKQACFNFDVIIPQLQYNPSFLHQTHTPLSNYLSTTFCRALKKKGWVVSKWGGKLAARDLGSNEATLKAMRPWRGVAMRLQIKALYVQYIDGGGNGH